MSRAEYSEETTVLLRAYTQVRNEIYESDSLALAPYNHIVPRTKIPISWATHHEMVLEYLRTLANELNGFRRRISQLQAWRRVLPTFDFHEQMFLHIEIVDSVALSAASTPYALRSRLIFSAAHLSHQANLITDAEWQESRLPMDGYIDYKAFKACASRWCSHSELDSELGRLASGTIVDATGDFRNSYNHRLPLSLAHGISRTVQRSKNETGGWSYEFGGSPAVPLGVLCEALSEQHGYGLAGFFALSRMIEEQLSAIYSS